MKKWTWSATLITIIVLMAFAMTGCGNVEQTNTETEQKTLSYWVNMNANVATRIQSYNEVAMYQQREKDSGIHIEFIHPALGQEAEQFNLMIASKELPDIIEYGWAGTTGYNGGVQKAIDDGIIITLNDYMNSAPNFKKAMTDANELSLIYNKNSLTDAGDYYGFTTLNIGEYRVFAGPMIRRDWLEELGLPMPETIDEWTSVLRAFKEEKGVADPMTGSLSGLLDVFRGAFGVDEWYIDGSEVKYGPLEDGYKQFLTLLNQWYEEGLLDRNISTNQSTLIDSKIINGDSGALARGYIGGDLGRYLAQMRTENPDYDLIGTPYPVINKGDINRFPVMEGDVMSSNTAAVTTACNDPKLAVEWMDYWYSEDGYYLMNFGVEGDSYNMIDGFPTYTDKILHNPDGLSIGEALALHCRATGPAPGYKQAPEYCEQYFEFPQQVDSLSLWTKYTAPGRETQLPILTPTLEEAEEISSISTDLNVYISEMTWDFITGVEPLDNYDTFRDTLKTQFKVDRYIEMRQNQYERYLNR